MGARRGLSPAVEVQRHDQLYALPAAVLPYLDAGVPDETAMIAPHNATMFPSLSLEAGFSSCSHERPIHSAGATQGRTPSFLLMAGRNVRILFSGMIASDPYQGGATWA